MQLFIPEKINFVLNRLKNEGYAAYIVGGCVRDMLTGKLPNDYDITTSATPEQVKQLFDKTADTGIKHGTVTVIVEKTPIEVTTFRTENSYTDSRHPDNVEFVTDIKYDLSRRDFTVNAMAYNNIDGLVDLFGGKADIENRILRAVGNPEKRFCEDSLRILRLYRFASVLDFSIEKNTLDAAKKYADTLKNVSCERIFSELTKASCGVNTLALRLLTESGTLKFLGITNCKNAEKIGVLKNKKELRFFGFLKTTDSEIFDVLKKLKAPNSLINYCSKLSYLTSQGIPKNKTEIKRLLKNTSPEEFFDYLEYIKIFNSAETNGIYALTNDIISNNEPYKKEHLSINGDDLKKLGFKGKEIAFALERAVDFVIENPDRNKTEILIDFLSN